MFLFLLSLALAGEPADRPKLPPDAERLVQLANAAPPEFAADALLRVASNTKIEKTLREDLIARAFHLAAGAQLHTPLNSVGQLADTRSGMVASAARLNLDTLSLQSRAVRGMLELDKQKARDLFLEINQPSAAQSCDQPLVPDTGQLYGVLASVANETFTDLERRKEEPVNLVMGYIARAASPNEIPPIEQMVASLNVTAAERDVLTTRVNGLRQSLVPQACPAIKTTDTFWTSDQAKRLFEGGVQLRAKKADTPEWRDLLTDYLKDLAGWSATSEMDEATYFHEKAIIYEMLADLIPPGPDRDKAVAAFVDFLANSTLQREKPVEWFFHAETLVTRARNSNTEAATILSAFENSGNPVLILYTQLEVRNANPPASN